jgi:hypothetical protein
MMPTKIPLNKQTIAMTSKTGLKSLTLSLWMLSLKGQGLLWAVRLEVANYGHAKPLHQIPNPQAHQALPEIPAHG